MNPRSTALTCLTVFLTAFILTGVWTAHAFAASQPLGSGTVLGASTDTSITSLAALPILTKYPVATTTSTPSIAAKEYALYNPESGKLLLSSSTMAPVPIASTTKLMTAYLAIKYGSPTDIVTIPKEAADAIPSRMGLSTGQQMSVESLLYGALMVSGNDAALTLGWYVGGIILKDPNASYDQRITAAVDTMNSTALSLGLYDTKYQDPAGLNDKGRSTAVDLVKLLAIDLKQPLLKQIFATAQTTVTDAKNIAYDLRNSDHITSDFNYPGNLGGKTGLTDEAGHCLVSAANQNGITLIGVVLNTNSQSILASANEVKKLLDFGFSSFTWQ